MGKKMGILVKLLISFLIISSVPLILLGYIAHKNLNEAGLLAIRRAEEMGARNLASAEQIRRPAIEDSVEELDNKSTEAIELRTVELTQKIADFLYERDTDILILTSLEPDAETNLKIYLLTRREVILPEERPSELQAEKPGEVLSRNPENRQSWRHRPPYSYKKESRPLYREITLIDLKGQEQIKIKDEQISTSLMTEDGGSGSFLIFWSGLLKLTTYAAIPYYTGPYGNSKRDFGYVTTGANVDEFHKAGIEESIMQIKKTLVVDDQKPIYSYLHKKFLKLGYTVFTADDGEQAIEQAFSNLSDIIIFDVKLPKLSGIEVCKKLKSDQYTSNIPIIMLSAKAQSNEIKEGLEAGADKYLCKPIGFPDILREIKDYEES
jgi:CheY-like chemotaxis protein